MSRPLILTGLQIDELRDRLLAGRIGLHQVPVPLCSWYWAGMSEPDHAMVARIEMLETDLNFWYWRATAPEEHAQRMASILTHADVQAARTATEARWVALDIAENARQAALDATVTR